MHLHHFFQYRAALSLTLALPFLGLFVRDGGAAAPLSPVNQVFQFAQTDTCSAWSTGKPTTATAYLWIPEECRRVRGVLVLCANVPEHRLVGHPAIRAVCAANGLAIFWGVKSFYNFQAKNENATAVAFLQSLLDGLAATSGYEEIATVPWLPIGESGHLLMVDALLENSPDRCLAGIYVKNNHLPPKNRITPTLVAFGTAQEWSQDKSDIRTGWNNIHDAYEGILKQRAENPRWPLSYVIDGTSGHFDCSDRLTDYFAHYIDCVAKARLSPTGGAALKPVATEEGFLADLPVPGHEDQPVRAAAQTAGESRGLPWYFDSAAAGEAQEIARINWKAKTQFIGFTDERGQPFPFLFDGITLAPLNRAPNPPPVLPTPVIQTEPDGITFTVKPVLLDKIPQNFAGAGEALAKTPGTPGFEWLCGCVEPLGGDRFRLALDRTWPSPIYVAARHPGTADIRGVVQPLQIGRDDHADGQPQKITFDPIADVKAGTASIPLRAASDAGLPVRFFVVAGPGTVENDTLLFTKIPPRTRFSVSVTVAAWQWGRGTEPKIKSAGIVRQTFQILAP